jgi:hypothetical protein
MLRLESEISGKLDQTRNRQGFAVDDIAALDRSHPAAGAPSAQFEKTGKCCVARGKWLLGGLCQKVTDHSRCREVPKHQIAGAKASGIMCGVRRWDCKLLGFGKIKILGFR